MRACGQGPFGRSPLDDHRIDRLWISAAAHVGLRVERTLEAYASSDGRGAIFVGAPETLDVDDSLAQLVFHELCHALVEGEGGLVTPDWGLENTSDRDRVREHACLRLQAHLAGAHGLRSLMAPTTDSRGYYCALEEAALDGTDPACVVARAGLSRAQEAPWKDALARALADTAQIALATPMASR